MKRRIALAAAGSVVALVLASTGARLALSAVEIEAEVFFSAALVSFTVIGAFIVVRRPGNAMGWLFAAVGLLGTTGELAFAYAERSYVGRANPLPGGVLAAWYAEWSWLPLLTILLVFQLFLFPNGRLPSVRWRPAFWLAAILATAFTALAALDPTLEAGHVVAVSNPIGVSPFGDVEDGVLGGLLIAFMASSMLAAALSLASRFRHSRGEERQQLKWFTYAGTLLAVGWAALGVADGLWNVNSELAYGVLALLVPLAVAISIFRYRLYDVGIIINRTLVYGVLTAVLAGTYFGLVVLLQLVFQPLTQGSDLAIAGSTLAVAALFRPARRRIQVAVDRRFYRRKYDAGRTLEAFSARLREHFELESLSGELRFVVRETMQPAHVSVWLREAGP